MKFEKFFKMAGTHGVVYKGRGEDRYLIAGGVGMKIPIGVNAVLGLESKKDPVLDAILSADTEDDVLALVEAQIPADGKASEIVRIFETDSGDRIGISNANYGLLEKYDRLVYVEIEDNEDVVNAFIVVTDPKNKEIVGFIQGDKEV